MLQRGTLNAIKILVFPENLLKCYLLFEFFEFTHVEFR